MRTPKPVTSRTTVLIVEDETAVRVLERRCLQGEGHDVIEASNGADAMEMVARGATFDLLVADVQMPGMRGDEMVRRIRVARPRVKVLYVTGNVDLLAESGPLIEGLESVLEKPFSARTLAEAVSALLDAGRRP